MTFDDDLRNRFSSSTAAIGDLDAGAAAVEAASTRRSTLRRVGGVGAVVAILLAGLVAMSTLGEDQASDIRTADPDVPAEPQVSDDPVAVPTTAPDAQTDSVVPNPEEGTAIVTIDVDGVVRINDETVNADEEAAWRVRLEAMATGPSEGPNGQTLNRRLGTATADPCPVNTILDANGNIVDDHPLNKLSRCVPGEIADWSSAGHVVLASPTQEDAWSVLVLGADGRSSQLTSPGAFQPLQLDVHTDASGRTQALILGTGEELVYIDVDAFLDHPFYEDALYGISNETNVVSALFVDGLEQHPYQDIVERALIALRRADPPILDPSSAAMVFSVSNVASDDTLNARSGPGTSFDVVFEFEHNATGVVGTGDEATSDDGARWVEVYSPTAGAVNDSGWVNASFLTETVVSDSRPCLFNGPQDHYIGIDWSNPDGSSASEASVISNIETYRFGGCIRTVLEFSDGWSYQVGGANRVTALPTDIVVTRDEPPHIDFGVSISGAEVADARFAERPGVAQSTFVSVGPGGTLDGVLYTPTTMMFATFDNTNGTLIVDIADIPPPLDADPSLIDRLGNAAGPSIDESGLILDHVSNTADGRTWTFTGLARPFEANLAVEVRTTNDEPFDVGWINGVADGRRHDNGVMTSTWTEAWGQYSFSITIPDGVDPANVVVVFDASGGAVDDPETVELRLADWMG